MHIQETRIAKCYILHENDDSNRCELTDRKLLIVRKHKRQEFPVEYLKAISFNQRKLLIPIIFGGIICPLSLTGLFTGLFHPLPSLLLIIGSIFVFYFGWQGQKVLTVYYVTGHRDFEVPVITDNLRQFLEYVNLYIQKEPMERRSYYLVIEDRKLVNEGEQETHISGDVQQRGLYSYWQLKDRYMADSLSRQNKYIMLDPLKIGSEIRYKNSGDAGSLRPVIEGKVRREAVIRIMEYEELSAIFI